MVTLTLLIIGAGGHGHVCAEVAQACGYDKIDFLDDNPGEGVVGSIEGLELWLNSVCGIRSTGRICTDLADALTEKGHEVKIAYGRESVPEKYRKYAVRIGNDFVVKLHGIKARLFDASGFGSKRATIEFVEWVKEFDPDVIHIHNIHGYYINIEILFDYLKSCGKRIIWTLHDCWAFTGHCSYFDFVGCNKFPHSK